MLACVPAFLHACWLAGLQCAIAALTGHSAAEQHAGLQEGKVDGRPHSICVYTPSRTVAVYALAETCDAHSDEGPLGIPGLGVKDRGPFFER